MTCKLTFHGGPWNGQTREDPTPVPTEVIKVFADAETDALCADEQVTELLGRYRKAAVSIMGGDYTYRWENV